MNDFLSFFYAFKIELLDWIYRMRKKGPIYYLCHVVISDKTTFELDDSHLLQSDSLHESFSRQNYFFDSEISEES